MKRSHQVAWYVNDEELAQLKAQVAKRGVTLSRYLKERALGNDQTDPCPQTGTSDPQNATDLSRKFGPTGSRESGLRDPV